MPKQENELVVIEKTQELLVWSLKHIEKFPRTHRHGLGLRIEERLSLILDLLIEAKFNRERLPLLQRCNLLLEQLRFQFRSAKDVRCLSIDSYGSASRFVNEIGQNLGLWIKSVIRGDSHETPRRTVGGTDQLSQPAESGPQGRPR